MKKKPRNILKIEHEIHLNKISINRRCVVLISSKDDVSVKMRKSITDNNGYLILQ